MSQDRLQPLLLQLFALFGSHLIHRLLQVHDHMEAVHHVLCPPTFLAITFK